MYNEEICLGCMHPLSNHFKSVNGKVYCLITNHGTTTIGITGMPYASNRCDCVNYHSEMQAAENKQKEEKQRRFDEMVDEVINCTKEQS